MQPDYCREVRGFVHHQRWLLDAIKNLLGARSLLVKTVVNFISEKK